MSIIIPNMPHPRLILLLGLLIASLVYAGDPPPITITGHGPAVAIDPNFTGFNNQTGGTSKPWSQAHRRAMLTEIAPASLRIPGGTISTYWDMRNDRVFRAGPEVSVGDDVVLQENYIIGWMRNLARKPQPNPMADLARIPGAFAEAAQAPDFIFVLNMVTPGHDYYAQLWQRPVDPTPLSDDWWAMLADRFERNIDAIDRARSAGLRIRHLELGNEFFFGISAEPYISGGQQFKQGPSGKRKFDGPFITGAFPSLGEAYAYAANDWAKRLKERYSDVRISAVGGDATSLTQADRRRHWNRNVVSLLDRELIDAITLHVYTPVPADIDAFEGSSRLGHWIAHWKEHWLEMVELSAIPTDVDIWLSEWDNGFQRYPRDGTHALMGSFTLGQFLQTGQVRLTSYHQFADAFTDQGPRPIAQVLSLWAEASRGATSARAIEFAGEALLPHSLTPTVRTPQPSLEGWEFTDSGESPRILLTNYSHLTVEVDRDLFAHAFTEVTSLAFPDLASEAPATIQSNSLDPASITLPPFSVTVLR